MQYRTRASRGGGGPARETRTARATSTAGTTGTAGTAGATGTATAAATETTAAALPSATSTASTTAPSTMATPHRPPGTSPSSQLSAPPAKRQRVSRACDQCRTMREKCDGAQPQCSSCVAQHRGCTYKTSPKKRGVQTGYIRTLELTLSSLLDDVPGCAEAIDDLFDRHGGDAAQRLFNPETSRSGSQQQQQQDLDRHNKLHRRWHKSRARKEINRMLSTDGLGGGGGAARAVPDGAVSDNDTDSDNGARTTATTTTNKLPAAAAAWSPSENTISSPMSGTGTGTGQTEDASRVGVAYEQRHSLRLPPNHWRLLDVYFSYTHCWFPILERQDVLKTVYQYERELGEPTSAPALTSSSSPSAAMAELWSVLALASFQDLASRDGPSNNPDPPCPPDKIYNVARQMIPMDDGPFEIQHARALLLLALVNVGRRRYTAARVLVSLSRQILQDPAVGYGPMRQRIVDAVTGGCCILDAFLAVVRTSLNQGHPHTGMLPPHAAHSCDAAVVPEDGIDEWQPWVPCAGFGSIDDTAASERSPAYSLTTFNQLHNILTALQRRTTSPSDYGGTSAAAAASPYTFDGDALDRVLRHDVPFSSFVRSTETASAAVPSAYILRITFFWMRILLSFPSPNCSSSIDQSRMLLFADMLEQFVTRFGAAGAPPTLIPCVLSVVGHPSFKVLPPPLQERLSAVADSLESVWHAPNDVQTGAVLYPKQQTVATTSGMVPATTYPPPMPSSPEALQQQQRSTTSATATTSRQHRLSFLDTHAPPPLPPAAQPPRTIYAANQPAVGPAGAAAFGFHALPISPQTVAVTGAHSNAYQPMIGTPFVGGGGTGSGSVGGGTALDYDALLDDLSAVDYLDRLDADIGSQFMANLGFAPGIDNLGSMMGEFGNL